MTAHKPNWTSKKRITTSIKMTGIIIGLSLSIGSFAYFFLLVIGVLQPFSLYSQVEAEILKNPSLVSAFYQNLRSSPCQNNSIKFSVNYSHPLLRTPANEDINCTEFTLINASNKTSYIKIEHQPLAKEQVINSLVSSLNNVESNLFNHPRYESTLISGASNKMLINGIVISTSSQSSVVILLFPADAAGINALKSIAASYQRL